MIRMRNTAEHLDHPSAQGVVVPVMGGVLGLAVAMGIGRFAYTPLLPVMQDQFHFLPSFAGVLASWNYLGYLIGAILVGWLPGRLQQDVLWRYRFVMASLVGSALSTGAMAGTQSHILWYVLRGLGGLFSASVMIFSSSLIMDWLAMRRQTQKIGVFYSGVGVGIALTGSLVPLLDRLGGWRLGWAGLGIASLVMAGGAWFLMRPLRHMRKQESAFGSGGQPTFERAPFPLWVITLAYGFEGLGYIVMATFVTVFFRHVSGSPWLGDVSWIFVGLAGAPSTWIWVRVARAWGWGNAAYAAFMAQGVGILLPVVWPSVATAIVGSILFGGTFMGIATLSLSIGRQCAPNRAARVIGRMTVMFSVGQVVGPVAAGWLTVATHTYGLAELLSGLLIVATAALLWTFRRSDGDSRAAALCREGGCT